VLRCRIVLTCADGVDLGLLGTGSGTKESKIAGSNWPNRWSSPRFVTQCHPAWRTTMPLCGPFALLPYRIHRCLPAATTLRIHCCYAKTRHAACVYPIGEHSNGNGEASASPENSHAARHDTSGPGVADLDAPTHQPAHRRAHRRRLTCPAHLLPHRTRVRRTFTPPPSSTSPRRPARQTHRQPDLHRPRVATPTNHHRQRHLGIPQPSPPRNASSTYSRSTRHILTHPTAPTCEFSGLAGWSAVPCRRVRPSRRSCH
jgi:hypothetical protein